MFAIRRGGRDEFYYDRWAALRVDRMLLAGPDEAVRTIEGLTRTEAPAMVAWLCGAVFVDLDRRELLYWADQLFGRGVLHRFFKALLAERWPGWRTRWALQPVDEFAAALGRDEPGCAEARRRATLLEVGDDLFTRGWDELMEHYAEQPEELAAWIAGSGIEAVRDAGEYGCNAWVTVRGEDGTLYDQRCSTHAWDGLVLAGPRLIGLAKRGGPRPGMFWPGFEGDLGETLFIDEAQRTVHAWRAVSPWLAPAGHCAGLWPGYRVELDGVGPRRHIERSGRSFAEIKLPREELVTLLAEQLERTLGAGFSPQASLAREASRLQAEHPGSTVRIETAATSAAEVGVGTVPPELLARLGAIIDAVDGDPAG